MIKDTILMVLTIVRLFVWAAASNIRVFWIRVWRGQAAAEAKSEELSRQFREAIGLPEHDV